MTGNAFAPATLHVVSLRDGPWDAVVAAVAERAGAAGYAQETPPVWRRWERLPRETIAGSPAVVPDGQTGLKFELRA